jgi:hypothetical protein
MYQKTRIALKGSELNGDGNTKAVYTWPITELKKLKNTMIYACVMGEEEKKVSCNISVNEDNGKSESEPSRWR